MSERPLIRLTWTSSLRPDALAVIRVGERSILLAIERDLGTERGPILADKVDSYQRVYGQRKEQAPLHVGFVVDSRRGGLPRSAPACAGPRQDESVVTTWVVTEAALTADPYEALWTTPGGIEARVIDFGPHWTGNPWPYLAAGDLADPTTLEVLDDRVYRRIPMLRAAL